MGTEENWWQGPLTKGKKARERLLQRGGKGVRKDFYKGK